MIERISDEELLRNEAPIKVPNQGSLAERIRLQKEYDDMREYLRQLDEKDQDLKCVFCGEALHDEVWKEN